MSISNITSDSNQIKTILAEPNTVFLVLSGANAQSLFDSAIKVINKNDPDLWRVLWIKSPGNISAELRNLCYPNDFKEGIVLSLGGGLKRKVKAEYAAGDLSSSLDIYDAFCQG